MIGSTLSSPASPTADCEPSYANGPGWVGEGRGGGSTPGMTCWRIFILICTLIDPNKECCTINRGFSLDCLASRERERESEGESEGESERGRGREGNIATDADTDSPLLGKPHLPLCSSNRWMPRVGSLSVLLDVRLHRITLPSHCVPLRTLAPRGPLSRLCHESSSDHSAKAATLEMTAWTLCCSEARTTSGPLGFDVKRREIVKTCRRS